MKRILILIATIAILCSCKKSEIHDEIDNGSNNGHENYSSDINFSLNGSNTEEPALYEPSPTYNFLGYGYDVTQRYNHQSAVRASMLDVPTLIAENAYIYDNPRSTEFYSKNFVAENAAALAKKLSETLEATDGLKVFGKTIEQAFPSPDPFNSKYVYGLHTIVFIRERMKIYYEDVPGRYLLKSFTEDVKKLKAEELVKKYGTHMIIRLRVGSTFNVLYQSEVNYNVDRLNAMKIGYSYALRKAFGIWQVASWENNLKALNENSAVKLYFYAMGGDVSKLKIEKTPEGPRVDINEWNKSTDDNYKFIGLQANGLFPLYELIDNTAKRIEIKEYIKKYISTHEKMLGE